MAKNGVEGVYDRDPSGDPGAEFLPEITHMEAIEQGLEITLDDVLAEVPVPNSRLPQ